MGGRPTDARRLVLVLHMPVSIQDSSGGTASSPTIYKAHDPGPLLQGPLVYNLTNSRLDLFIKLLMTVIFLIRSNRPDLSHKQTGIRVLDKIIFIF